MSILVKSDTKVLVQGITGSFGARHTQLSIDYGTRIVAGVTPGKGGQVFEHAAAKVPIFDTVGKAVQETGATVTLAGGASPSPSVCWLVGPAGTVLLSTDGLRWQRLRFPETMDLMSVRAADDKIASVTASDGRTFSTRDRGLTWVRSSNVQ